MTFNRQASKKFIKKYLQSIVGIAIVVLFLIISISINYTLAQKNSGYGYGYSSSSYDYGYMYSSELPSRPTSFACASGGSDRLNCTWTAVTTAVDATSLDNFASYKIYRSTSAGVDTGDTLAATVTGQSTASATITGLSASQTYYLTMYTVDDNSNYSAAATETSATTDAGAGGGSGSVTPAPTQQDEEGEEAADDEEAEEGEEAAEEAEEVTADSAVPERSETPDLNAEVAALAFYTSLTGGALPGSGAGWSVIHFIAYGTADTANMSARDRSGLLADFQTMFGRLPGAGQSAALTASETDWIDVAHIARGEKTVQRNLDRERLGIREFVKVYKRLPVFSAPGDDLAVHYIAYRLRTPVRNLNSERSAIGTFRGLYGKLPASGHDWAIVRAVAYSGAVR